MKIWPFSRNENLDRRDANLADTDGILSALWSGAASGSVAISGAAALRVPAVACAVRVISEAAATLDVRIMERRADGVEVEDKNHAVGKLLRGDVNPWTSGFELIRDLTAGALTNDAGGLAFVNRVGEEVREVIRYQPAAITVQFDPSTGEPKYRVNGGIVQARNIVHVRGPFDKSPLTLAAEAIGAAKVMESHASNLFKNGARPGGILESPHKLGDEAVKAMLKAWRVAQEGADNAGRTAVLWDGVKWTPQTLNSVDSQFTELRRFQILEICRAFRIPPSMLFELERATWSNSEQMGREFLTYTLEPWLRTIEAALTRALFSRSDRDRYRVLLDRDDLTRADLTALATAISSLISVKVLNPNQARAWLALAPYGGGDEYGNPHINPNKPGDETGAEPKKVSGENLFPPADKEPTADDV
jgi:HK97 family phage portal protein